MRSRKSRPFERSIVVHVFNGEEKAISGELHGEPKVLGVKLAGFLQSLSDAQTARMLDRMTKLEW